MAVIVGFIPTPEGQAALERAAEEAELRHQRLVVVNSQRGGEAWTQKYAQALDDVLAAVRQRLDSLGIPHEVRSFIRGNDPAEDLIEVARATDASVIVIGLRKRSPVGKLILGSNAQRILLDSDHAVLAVKARAR